MAKKETDMLHGPLLGKIVMFALPYAATGILEQLFNSINVAVVGRFADSHALAAVGANTFLINLIINLFTSGLHGSQQSRLGVGLRRSCLLLLKRRLVLP